MGLKKFIEDIEPQFEKLLGLWRLFKDLYPEAICFNRVLQNTESNRELKVQKFIIGTVYLHIYEYTSRMAN